MKQDKKQVNKGDKAANVKDARSFVRWVRRRPRTTRAYIERFGLISLRSIVDLSNEHLIKGQIIHYAYLKDSGTFFKIKYVENNP